MKIKILSFLLCVVLISQNVMVFAEDNKSGAQKEFNSYSSYDDLSTGMAFKTETPPLTPIIGLDNCYILDNAQYKLIVDSNGKQLIDMEFRDVDTKLSPGDTLVVWYPVGMADSRVGVLNKDLEVIVPNKDYGGTPEFIESGGNIYIKVFNVITGEGPIYYDLNGNELDKSKISEIVSKSAPLKADNSYSKWAEESIIKSIKEGLVPESLQSKYTDKITRQEFCQLAIQTCISKTRNKKIDMTVKTPFTDVDDVYITTAYNLKIVSGVGDNKFAPNNNITRQEAAVMLNNLANVLRIDINTPKTEKFIDEKYFAAWAKNEIYNVTGIKSGDTFVMVGTEPNKFSPWMNYTREQAIATMWRLYNCEETEMFYDGQYLQLTSEMREVYGDWLYYEISKGNYIDESDRDETGKNLEIIYSLVRIKKDGSDRETLVSNKGSLNFVAIKDDYLYYVLFDEKAYHTDYKMKLDKSEITKITENEMEEAAQYSNKIVHNEKYTFFPKMVAFDGKSFSFYLTRSDLNGENEKRLYDGPISGQVVLYDNYVYFISMYNKIIVDGAEGGFEYTKDIMRADFDGNVENLTKNDQNDLDVREIVKIEDNTIFYRREGDTISISPSDSDLLYSMSVDGSNDKLIY